MNHRRRTLVHALALLVLLAGGFTAATAWPQPPSEAEQRATLIREGSAYQEKRPLLGQATLTWSSTQHDEQGVVSKAHRVYCWDYADRSRLRVFVDDDSGIIDHIFADSTSPAPPLTRLCRTLARVMPFLAEE
jgi:hypothetical protein